jgi:hypothetical protein
MALEMEHLFSQGDPRVDFKSINLFCTAILLSMEDQIVVQSFLPTSKGLKGLQTALGQ